VRALPLPALLALAAACAAACDDSPTPPASADAVVGTYAIEATYTTLRPDVLRGERTPVDAILAGTVVVGDSLAREGTLRTFPDVALTASFCPARDACPPAERFGGYATHQGPGTRVALDFAAVAGARTLHFEGPLAGDSIAGFAWYGVGSARYDGSFVARRRR
jgi:hypothetical protein